MMSFRSGHLGDYNTVLALYQHGFEVGRYISLERPGVSRDMIRRVLRKLRQAEVVECIGHGPGAQWRKRGNTL